MDSSRLNLHISKLWRYKEPAICRKADRGLRKCCYI